ncbi:FAD-binding oxidoreductase [Streptomyces sp. ERV7]|uniref:FAD-binding oxidoreductase n=1 Tax=Streptomyces sp. ERV7 TaxID=1322334 RepID=UPI0009A01D10|nr:FAD-binding protein [Streptomyces sp. ERV7]
MITRRSFIGMAGAGAAAVSLSGFTTATATTASQWDRLRAHLTGTLVLPSDSSYTAAKTVEYGQYSLTNPQAIVYAANADDVTASLLFGQYHDIPVTARSGGHSGGGFSTTTGLIIDVSRLNAVTAGSGTATVGGGTQLVDVVNGLGASGLAIPGGMFPTVALGGFLQGGGVGLLTRHSGLGADKVTSAKVVLASGRQVTASPTSNPDLYWAIRGGGGGNFGIVTQYTVTPTAVPNLNVAELLFSYDHAVGAMHGLTQWLETAPTTFGSRSNIDLFDSAAGHAPLVTLLVTSIGTRAEFDTEIARLIALTGAAPIQQNVYTDTYKSAMMKIFGCGSYSQQQCHNNTWDPANGKLAPFGHVLGRGRLLSRSPSETEWARLVGVFDTERTAGHFHKFEIMALGGAANKVSRTSTAYVHRDSTLLMSYYTFAFGILSGDELASGQRFVDNGFTAVDPISRGESYQNFIDPALTDWREAYYGENYNRLSYVKSKYDPYGVFSFAQGID